MLRRLPYLLLLPAMLACSKSDSSPAIDFGKGEGITYRDNANRPAGPDDPTDWTSDATWSDQEKALFADLQLNLNGSQQPALAQSGYAFPNPGVGATWGITTQRNATGGLQSYGLRAVLVDHKYQVLKRLTEDNILMSQHFSFDYASMGLSINQTYRLYYVVYNTAGLVFKGHGDVRHSN